MFLSLTFLPPNDQGVEPNLQMIICQDAPQVCQVNKIIFLLPRKVRSLLISVVVIMCDACDSKSALPPAQGFQHQKMAKESKQGAYKTFL